MEVDKLLIVAHPDDEVLWGGMNLLTQPGWLVLCSTHANDPVRRKEFYNTMSYCNVTRYMMFDVEDTYTEDPAVADTLYDGTPFEKALKELTRRDWKLVLTHNDLGEYGHEHHRKVHRMVRDLFPGAKFFKVGQKLSASQIELKRSTLRYYRKTQSICKKIFDKKGHTLKLPEREHFFDETVYVKHTHEIPKFIHQIWFGKELDPTSVRYHLMNNLKKVAEKHGWGYKVWTNADLTPETFPMTWDFIQISIRMGEELEQSRFAQVADLARLEILHRFGGVYLDSLFEIGVEFLSEIGKLGKTHDLIVANEDPCKLKCVGANDKKYMSNGFFACIPGCPTLKRLLNYDSLESIDFENVHINQTTGPYYFRSMMESKDKIFAIDTEKIYPFMVNDSKYRKAKENNCVTEGKVIHDCLKKKYPDSLAIYHSGFGGSWSW